MKKFSQFLSEAGETTVSSQARKMGLKGDGHGGWYDQQGKFKAKTVDGKLKVFSGREAKAEEVIDYKSIEDQVSEIIFLATQ